MVQPLIVQYYQLIPTEDPTDGNLEATPQRRRRALARYRQAVEARYTEATLERLLFSRAVEARQAAIVALGLMGTMRVNGSLARCLHDEDAAARELAAESLWAIWRRGDCDANKRDLRRLMRAIAGGVDSLEILGGFEALLRKAPRFAEAYNQRAIYFFRRGDVARAIRDCEKALRLNPYHFGAACGLGQCFTRQRKHRAALRVYRRAHRINPNLDSVRDAIESLEKMLGEEGKR